MLTEIPESRPARKLIAYQLLSRQREQHLPSVGCGEEPRHPVYRRTEVVPIRSSAAPVCKAILTLRGPLSSHSEERSLRWISRRLPGHQGQLEGTTEGVTHSLEDVATMVFY